MKLKVYRMELEFCYFKSPILWMTYNDARFDRERYFLDRVLFVNFDLNGPSRTVDTACSSSLLTVIVKYRTHSHPL